MRETYEYNMDANPSEEKLVGIKNKREYTPVRPPGSYVLAKVESSMFYFILSHKASS